ncbi:MAG: hypothetical protein V4708_11480 [Bacteroidota bacterium]
MTVNSITHEEIELLNPDQLIDLLDILIAGEIALHYLPGEVDKAIVPRPIRVKDGGEDAYVKLDLDPAKKITSRWLKQAYTSFQAKATDLSDTQCYDEVVKTDRSKGKFLKPRIQDCVDNKGEYVLFIRKAYTSQAIKLREKKIREAFSDCGVIGADKYPIRIIGGNEIEKWANTNIAAVTHIQMCRKITRPLLFRTWKEWKKEFDTNKRYVYQESDYLAKKSENLYEQLEKNKIVRVVGHKGIGKSRFVLECFDPNRSTYINTLSDLLVYVDLAVADFNEIGKFIYSQNSMEGIVVLDNCPDDWHTSYSTPIKSGGNLKIITIYDSLEKNSEWITIDRISQKDTVRMILESCFKGFEKSQIDHLLKITEGFPEMIPFIEKAINETKLDVFFSHIPDDFIEKFLFPKGMDREEMELFRACALFTEFPFFDDKIEDLLSEQQKEKIKEVNKLIYTSFVDNPLTHNKFYKFCRKYRDDRSLLEKRGFLYSVIPEPIAVSLAVDWWKDHEFSYVESLLGDLIKTELLVPMMDRVKMLDQSERGQTMAGKAWGPNGPFATAEVLNTELGSRLFRSVVEVNPEKTLQGIENAYEEYTSSDFNSLVKQGRRNLVWALEKLAFRKETFHGASILLMKFAAGENENYGNNATAQFLQLFHIHLSGTEVDYNERLKIINWGLLQGVPEFEELSILAMGSGLRSQGFSRMGGAERQGFSTFLQDYHPKNWVEIANYWIAIIKLLTKLSIEGRYRNLAKDTIAGSLRGMISNNLLPVVNDAMLTIISKDSSVWESAIKNLNLAKSYEANLPEEIETINKLLELLSPGNLADKLQLKVILPIWDHSPGNIRGEITQQAAELLAEEINANNLDLSDHFTALLTGEQRQTYNFAARLAKGYSDLDQIIDGAIESLKRIPKEKQNPSLIAGIMSVVKPSKQREIIAKITEAPEISFNKFFLLRLIDPQLEEVLSLFDLVDKNEADISHFSALQYGRMLENLSTESILEICSKIASYGQKGAWTSFIILATYYYSNEEKWLEMKGFIRQLTMEKNFLLDINNLNSSDSYQWSQAVIKLLDGTSDTEYAISITKQFISGLNTRSFPYFDHSIKEFVNILFQQYFSNIWPHFSKALISSGEIFMALKEVVGSHNGANGYPGLLQFADAKVVVDWIKKSGEKAMRRISYIMPCFGEKDWHPFAKRLIDEFGEEEGFLDEVAANLGSFSMVGSSDHYYESIIDMMKTLRTHKFAKVRKWAKNGINSYERRILSERLQEESRK